MPRLMTAMLLLLLLFDAGARSKHPDNKLVEFKRSGSWEIWCIKLGDSGQTVCDLNLVIIYKPHPDFRAMIPRVYWTERGTYAVEIEYERQTSFSSAFIESESDARFALQACERPCWFKGGEADKFVAFLTENTGLKISFSDYFIQDFQIDFDVRGFKQGLGLLKAMQTRLR